MLLRGQLGGWDLLYSFSNDRSQSAPCAPWAPYHSKLFQTPWWAYLGNSTRRRGPLDFLSAANDVSLYMRHPCQTLLEPNYNSRRPRWLPTLKEPLSTIIFRSCLLSIPWNSWRQVFINRLFFSWFLSTNSLVYSHIINLTKQELRKRCLTWLYYSGREDVGSQLI